jgi:hypothetical protein
LRNHNHNVISYVVLGTLAVGNPGYSTKVNVTTVGGFADSTWIIQWASTPTVSNVTQSNPLACGAGASHGLQGCNPSTTNTLTIMGTNLFGPPLSVTMNSTNVCTGALTLVSNSMITCLMANAPSIGYTTMVSVTTNGGISAGGPTFAFAPLPTMSGNNFPTLPAPNSHTNSEFCMGNMLGFSVPSDICSTSAGNLIECWTTGYTFNVTIAGSHTHTHTHLCIE